MSLYSFCNCGEKKMECSKFLDEPFFVPSKAVAEIIEKTFATLIETEKIPTDLKINKNDAIRN